MAVKLRNYNDCIRYGDDYSKIRDFLIELNNPNYQFGRWDWMYSHSYLEKENLSKIGIWEDDDKIVGFVTFDTTVDGNCFFLLMKDYDYLSKEMIKYAEENLSKDEAIRLLIQDNNEYFQNVASLMGYKATEHKGCDLIINLDNANLHYDLPKGFAITSMAETYDLFQYGRILWKGFNHEINGEGAYAPTKEMIAVYRDEFERPNVNPFIKVAVIDDLGNFVSYCGMWYDSKSKNALVEPVATAPEFRKMGLGKAAVLEGIKRCKKLGAKKVYVGSSQQFYYNIGFKPYSTTTMWVKKK